MKGGSILDFKDLDINNVKTIKVNELTNVLFKSLDNMMEVQFIELAKHDLSKEIYIPKYENIKKEIKYEYENLNRKKVYKMVVPIVDETKLTKFITPVFSKSISNVMPVRDYFILLDAEIKIMPLGLIEVYFKGFKRPRMDKDYQNLTVIKEYTRTEYLYFDYEENEFKQLVTEALEDVKKGLQKGKTLDKLLENKEPGAYIKTYIERKDILDGALGRLNEYADGLQDKFLEFIDDKYDVKWENGRIARNFGEVLKTDVTSIGISSYLNRYGKTMLEVIPDWLKINLIFSNITSKEYKRLKEYNLKLSEDTLKITDLLTKISLTIEENNKLRKSQEIQEILFNELDWNKPKGLYIQEEESIKLIIESLEALEKPKETRPDKFDKDSALKGYIYDKKTGELCPRLGQMEYRRYLREDFGSKFEDLKYIEMVYEELKKGEK